MFFERCDRRYLLLLCTSMCILAGALVAWLTMLTLDVKAVVHLPGGSVLIGMTVAQMYCTLFLKRDRSVLRLIVQVLVVMLLFTMSSALGWMILIAFYR